MTLDAERITTALASVLGDSPWADRADDFARDLQDVLDQLRAEGMDATADTLATGANQLLAPFADIGTAAIAMTDDPTDLHAAKREAFQAVLDGKDVFLDRLPGLREELAASAGGDTVPAVTDEAVFDEIKALELEARSAMSAIDGGDGNGPANAVLRGMQQMRATLRQDRSVADVTGRFEDSFNGTAATHVNDLLRHAAESEGAPPPPDAAEDFLNDVCFGLGFIPVGPGGVGDDIMMGFVLAMFGLETSLANDEACTLLADGMTVALALIDMALVFVEVAGAFAIGSALPSGAGLLFIMFFLLSIWIALKLMCDAIAIATVLQECAG